jgi:hypothetical protein
MVGELNSIDPFHYLTGLQRHSAELAAGPARWMPWNYRQTVARLKDTWPRNIRAIAFCLRLIKVKKGDLERVANS